ncbi:MAG: AAA family ATPase [Pirellulaceae bacterium]
MSLEKLWSHALATAPNTTEPAAHEESKPHADDAKTSAKAEAEAAEATYQRTRTKLGEMLDRGELEQRKVEISVEAKSEPMMLGMGRLENMDIDLQKMFERVMPRNSSRREVTVAEARRTLIEQEVEALFDMDKIHAQAVELAESQGMIFLDELDKIVASEARGADVSRHGVQRDLLPIVEGTTVQTRYGYVKTDHILFIAAGAFHRTQPSDLMPELQGRFPIRVELKGLSKQDFERILREPQNSLLRQYVALLGTEGVQIEFTDEAIDLLAHYADQVNRTTQNIGARRLATILERLLEEGVLRLPTWGWEKSRSIGPTSSSDSTRWLRTRTSAGTSCRGGDVANNTFKVDRESRGRSHAPRMQGLVS